MEGSSTQPARARFFGQYLIACGHITRPQLLAAVELQSRFHSRLGELAVALGMLTPYDVQHVHAVQLGDDALFGQTALRRGFLTGAQLHAALQTQRKKRVRLGQALQQLGYIDESVLRGALEGFEREQLAATVDCSLPKELAQRPWIGGLFARAQRLLLRAWDLPNKPGRIRIERARLTLSDHNVRVELLGGVARRIVVGVPNEVAQRVRCALSGGSMLGALSLSEVLHDFARLLAELAARELRVRGEPVRIGAVDLQGVRATLPPDERVVMVSFFTHCGQVLVGSTF